MGRGSWAFGAVMLITATGGSAVAQVAAPPSGIGSPGGGRPVRTFAVTVQALVEHDSNLTRQSEASAILSQLTPSDTIYAPTVNVNFVMPVGRQAIFLNGSGSYLFHQTNTQLNNERVNIAGGGSLSLGPCGAVLRGGYARGRNELTAPGAGQTGAVSDGATGSLLPTTSNLESTIRNIETVEDVSLGLSCSRSSGIGINGQVAQQWTSNSEVISGSGSYRATSASVGISYQRPAFGSLSLAGIYGRTIYGGQLAPQLVPRGFETTGANLSFSRQLGGRIQAQATAGYTRAHQLSPPPIPIGVIGNPFADFSGFTYTAGASFRATRNLTARATFQRQISPTLLSGSSYEVLTGYGLGVQYTLGTHITVDVRGDRQQSRTNGAILTNAAQSLTDSRVNDLSASVSYRFNRRLSVQLSGTRETRTADNTRFAYSNDRVALTLSSNF